MTNKPIEVGVTGGIGSGKSTVCNIFRLLGVPIYEADLRAKALMISNTDLREAIIANFGKESYLKNGNINRAYMSEVVFSDESKTNLINSLVHPAVYDDYKKWVAHRNSHSYLVKEAALLFEAGSYKNLDKIIVVTAPVKKRIERILMRDHHRSEIQIQKIIDKQWPEEEKTRLAHFVIKNDNSHLLIPQVIKIHEKLLE
jgi:dephospho-CoA kinase